MQFRGVVPPRHWLRTALPVLAALALGLAPARPARAVTVSVAPADTTVSVGGTFTVRIVTTAFTDLKAYSLNYGFDPVMVQFLTATPGEVLTLSGSSYTTQLVPDHTAPADSIHYDCAALSGTTNGPGVLAYFKFKALAVGTTTLDCQRIDFRNSLNQQTLPACSAGTVHIIGITRARVSGWGSVRTIYR